MGLAIVGLTLGLVARPSAAQQAVIVGAVRDTRGSPIPGAEALLLSAKKKDHASDRGWFVLDSLEAGPDILVVRAIGYRARTMPISLGPADSIEVVAVLQPLIQVLPELTVTAYGRELTGVAAEAAVRFMRNGGPPSGLITRADIETWGHHDLGSVLRRAGLGLVMDSAVCPWRSGAYRPGERPIITVYLDGMRLSEDQQFDVRAIPPEWVEAIEVYRSVANRPVEYNMTSSTGCLVLIWTRR